MKTIIRRDWRTKEVLEEREATENRLTELCLMLAGGGWTHRQAEDSLSIHQALLNGETIVHYHSPNQDLVYEYELRDSAADHPRGGSDSNT